MNVRDKVIAVTGAGSGIGRALSEQLAEKGAIVAAGDINEEAVNETVTTLDGASSGHRAYTVNVADRDSMEAYAADVDNHFGRVDGIINNAGVLGRLVPFNEFEYEELKRIVDINLWGVINGTWSFLPYLRERPESCVVNVSSAAGLLGTLGNQAYYASKFGVRGFTESIQSELWKTNVRTTIVYPGVVKTNLGGSHPDYTDAERAEAIRRYHAQPGLSPEAAAKIIVSGIEKGKAKILVGKDVWFLDKLTRLTIGRPDRFMRPALVIGSNRQQIDGKKRFR